MIQIGQVASPLQWDRWPEARDMLAPALALSDEPMSEVEAELSADTMQLVGVMQEADLLAVVVTRSAVTTAGEMLELYLCGGREAQRWASSLVEALKDAARRAGMIGLRIIGRMGWERLLAPNGFSRTATILECRFSATETA